MKRISLLNSFSNEAHELKGALDDISSKEGYEIEIFDGFDIQEIVSGAIWGLINLCDVLAAFVNSRSESIFIK